MQGETCTDYYALQGIGMRAIGSSGFLWGLGCNRNKRVVAARPDKAI